MYTPAHFAVRDLEVLDALFQRDAFITLITTGDDGFPFASHLPVLYHREGESVRVSGHWSKANPQAIAGGKALLIAHGPHAYISPRWYTDPERQVPTWNYAVAHLRGELTTFDDTQRLQGTVAQLAAAYEQPMQGDWRFPESAPAKLASLRGIVGFDFEPTSIAIKCKFNQNHPEANRHSAIHALRARGGHDAEVADWMQWLNFGRD